MKPDINQEEIKHTKDVITEVHAWTMAYTESLASIDEARFTRAHLSSIAKPLANSKQSISIITKITDLPLKTLMTLICQHGLAIDEAVITHNDETFIVASLLGSCLELPSNLLFSDLH